MRRVLGGVAVFLASFLANQVASLVDVGYGIIAGVLAAIIGYALVVTSGPVRTQIWAVRGKGNRAVVILLAGIITGLLGAGTAAFFIWQQELAARKIGARLPASASAPVRAPRTSPVPDAEVYPRPFHVVSRDTVQLGLKAIAPTGDLHIVGCVIETPSGREEPVDISTTGVGVTKLTTPIAHYKATEIGDHNVTWTYVYNGKPETAHDRFLIRRVTSQQNEAEPPTITLDRSPVPLRPPIATSEPVYILDVNNDRGKISGGFSVAVVNQGQLGWTRDVYRYRIRNHQSVPLVRASLVVGVVFKDAISSKREAGSGPVAFSEGDRILASGEVRVNIPAAIDPGGAFTFYVSNRIATTLRQFVEIRMPITLETDSGSSRRSLPLALADPKPLHLLPDPDPNL